uniref:Uncharacterized protein n=1 Tax=Arundo donax TaxID=35708 RepID=A0A0A9CPJ0_ARUDO
MSASISMPWLYSRDRRPPETPAPLFTLPLVDAASEASALLCTSPTVTGTSPCIPAGGRTTR